MTQLVVPPTISQFFEACLYDPLLWKPKGICEKLLLSSMASRLCVSSPHSVSSPTDSILFRSNSENSICESLESSVLDLSPMVLESLSKPDFNTDYKNLVILRDIAPRWDLNFAREESVLSKVNRSQNFSTLALKRFWQGFSTCSVHWVKFQICLRSERFHVLWCHANWAYSLALFLPHTFFRKSVYSKRKRSFREV